jgi:hypothetical protein
MAVVFRHTGADGRDRRRVDVAQGASKAWRAGAQGHGDSGQRNDAPGIAGARIGFHGYLPKDTSFAQRYYSATNGAWALANVILMGADRTSIHRPDYCIPGQGWQINERARAKLAIAGGSPYELPVGKWTIGKTFTAPDGSKQTASGLYVFWFVTENQATDDFPTMLKSMLFHLVRHGVLQRWAYVSYFTVCPPGTEEATFARMKELISASVPEFQLPPAAAK